jgi:hypothetical protein
VPTWYVQNSRFSHQNQSLDAVALFWCANPVQNKPIIYGYARVSTGSQSEAAQVAILKKHGAGKVVREVAQGDKTDRAKLRRLLDQLDAGDVLMVTRLDRLARSTRDLLNTLAAITGKKANPSTARRRRSAARRRPACGSSSGARRAGTEPSPMRLRW